VQIRMNRILSTVFFYIFPLFLYSQDKINQNLYGIGTCATAALAPSGATAFIIDSRITWLDPNGAIASQSESCKVRLPRPTILIAGVGISYASNVTGRWYTLDEATRALVNLPEHPSERDLDLWGAAWGTTLLRHYRLANEKPPGPGEVAEMLLVTKVNGVPYYRRTTVIWDGQKFELSIAGQQIDKSDLYFEYSGKCRDFVNHDNGEGGLTESKYRTPSEHDEMNEIAYKAREGATAHDLAIGILGLEQILTRIDERLEGDKAVIAPPYATAEWEKDADGWTTHFNPACTPNKSSSKASTTAPAKTSNPKKSK
jgi:hypothetical protein